MTNAYRGTRGREEEAIQMNVQTVLQDFGESPLLPSPISTQSDLSFRMEPDLSLRRSGEMRNPPDPILKNDNVETNYVAKWLLREIPAALGRSRMRPFPEGQA